MSQLASRSVYLFTNIIWCLASHYLILELEVPELMLADVILNQWCYGAMVYFNDHIKAWKITFIFIQFIFMVWTDDIVYSLC